MVKCASILHAEVVEYFLVLRVTGFAFFGIQKTKVNFYGI